MLYLLLFFIIKVIYADSRKNINSPSLVKHFDPRKDYNVEEKTDYVSATIFLLACNFLIKFLFMGVFLTILIIAVEIGAKKYHQFRRPTNPFRIKPNDAILETLHID